MDKTLCKVLAVFFLLIGAVSLVWAEDNKMTAAQPSMTEEQKAIQGRMQEYSTPDEHHDVLKSLAGIWKTNVKFWMDPAGPAMESEGSSDSHMIMDNHFLEQRFSGNMMGKPFEGRGIYGYDKMRKEYTGLWFDNMATGIMTSSAQYDSQTKTLAEAGSMSCPITNETHRTYRGVTTFIDDKHYTYETYMKDKDGKEFRSMLIEYTRAE